MSSFSTIACCLCGTLIEANEVAMCLICLRGEINITDGIGRNSEVVKKYSRKNFNFSFFLFYFDLFCLFYLLDSMYKM